MKEEIQKKVADIVKKLTSEDIQVSVTIPKDISKGDFTTNIAMVLFSRTARTVGLHSPGAGKPTGKLAGINRNYESPLALAEDIVKEFGNYAEIEYIEPASPGFINFYLSSDNLSEKINEVLDAPEKVPGISPSTSSGYKKYKKAVVEYSSPNIAKPFTVGHLRSTIIGDAIANLLETTGYRVYRDNHLGDWGTQFGKQIYAIKTWGNEEQIEKSENPVKELVSLYVKFHEEAEKNPELEDEARKWFKKLEDKDPEARRLWQKCIDWSFKEFDRIYKELGVTFTENNGHGYGESYFEDKMQAVVNELRKKNLLKEDKGAQLVFFPKDKYPPLMIIKADGATLYATRDLATDKFRYEQYGKDILVINEVGVEQSLYFKQLFETEYMLGWYKEGQRVHIGHGLYRFKEGKMSTRKGNVIWLEDVLKEAEERAFSLVKQDAKFKGSEVISTSRKEGKAARQNILGYAERINISKQVAIGALKWNDLKRSSHLDITFDWEEILSMNGNSGPYVQYAYTRTKSVLEKAESMGIKPQLSKDYTVLEDEKKLMQKLTQFSAVVEDAAREYAPNMVCEYLFELAQMFNNFYQKYRIINAESDKERQFRLALTKAVGIILQQGLTILGIQAPEKM